MAWVATQFGRLFLCFRYGKGAKGSLLCREALDFSSTREARAEANRLAAKLQLEIDAGTFDCMVSKECTSPKVGPKAEGASDAHRLYGENLVAVKNTRGQVFNARLLSRRLSVSGCKIGHCESLFRRPFGRRHRWLASLARRA
jgi:hypothetical protein